MRKLKKVLKEETMPLECLLSVPIFFFYFVSGVLQTVVQTEHFFLVNISNLLLSK